MKITHSLLVLAAFVLLAGSASLNPQPAQAQDFPQICYAVADTGGGPPGDNLLVMIDIQTRQETVVGSPGTFNIESLTFEYSTQTMYAADGDRLGTLDLETGLFTPHPLPFGNARGTEGVILINDVDGLGFDTVTGVLYGTHRRADADFLNDLLVQIDVESGSVIADAFGPGLDYVVMRTGEFTGRYHIDDIAFHPDTNEMFAINNYRGRNDLLVVINPQTGELVRIIGSLGIDGGLGLEDMEGLSFDRNGTLIGTTGRDGVPLADHIFWIDQVTGLANLQTAIPLTAGGDYEGVDCLALPPTAIDLIHFSAAPGQEQGSVLITWATGTEIDHYGFYLYRGSSPERRQAEEIHFVLGGSGAGGGQYSFIDTPPGEGVWWYWLGDVDLDGRQRDHGPVQVLLGSAAYQVYLPFSFSAAP
jgi:hypothetical protein